MSKRINKQLKQFFDENLLTDWEKIFIIGCIKAQDNSHYSQLTTRQWAKVLDIKRKYEVEQSC